ncbi:hypothetical protein [Succinimonas sp.]|uniref:hypothetical protein n=1 Tax=Succinimonas sp. TaxID=1936151 RepID=UPI00386A166D
MPNGSEINREEPEAIPGGEHVCPEGDGFSPVKGIQELPGEHLPLPAELFPEAALFREREAFERMLLKLTVFLKGDGLIRQNDGELFSGGKGTAVVGTARIVKVAWVTMVKVLRSLKITMIMMSMVAGVIIVTPFIEIADAEIPRERIMLLRLKAAVLRSGIVRDQRLGGRFIRPFLPIRSIRPLLSVCLSMDVSLLASESLIGFLFNKLLVPCHGDKSRFKGMGGRIIQRWEGKNPGSEATWCIVMCGAVLFVSGRCWSTLDACGKLQPAMKTAYSSEEGIARHKQGCSNTGEKAGEHDQHA